MPWTLSCGERDCNHSRDHGAKIRFGTRGSQFMVMATKPKQFSDLNTGPTGRHSSKDAGKERL